MEESKEHKFRLNMKQSAKGQWYGEFTIKEDDLEETVKLAKEMREHVEELCKEKTE